MSKIRFGVIGCGYIAKKAFLPAIKKSKTAELIAIASRDLKKSKLEAKNNNCDFENSYRSLLKRNDIDAVYISTIPSTHEEIIILAADYGKHILCEKPLSTSFSSAKKIIKYCEKKNIGIFEGFMYQFHNQHSKINKLVDKGEIGEPILFTASFGFPLKEENNYRYRKDLGGGSCLDAGCYTIHAARHFFKKEPTKIYSIINKKNNEVDIHGSVLMDFGDNKTAQLSFGFNNFYRNTYSIWGTKGYIVSSRAFSIPPNEKAKIIINKQDFQDEIICESDDNFLSQINYFCAGIDDSNKYLYWRDEIIKQAITVDKVLS
jgi:dTDP-3,4-didehydro-2,6-dideoxy-alpha-D-glucose 3-reductase